MISTSKFLQQTEEAPPNYLEGSEANIPILFHYTGFDSLISIAQNKELWATNIHYLNDYEEFKNALEIAKNHVKASQKGQSKETINFLQNMYDRIDTIENVNLHIVSFTANGDLLSQWRAYCPNGGVSVGFRYDDLRTLANQNAFTIHKCIYDEKIKQEIMKEVVDTHLYFFKEGEDVDQLLLGFITVLATVAPCFKHQAFEEEKEWRLISDLISVHDPKIGIRARTNTMIPYYRFSLEGLPNKKEKQNLCFDRYIIGPSANIKLASSAFGYFLNKYNLSYDHWRDSQIPYRTL